MERIAGREAEGSDASEADREVYFMQKKSREAVDKEEQLISVEIDCNDEASMRTGMEKFVADVGRRGED